MKKIELPDGLGLRLATEGDKPFIASLFRSTRECFYLAEQEPEYIRFVVDHQLELQTIGYGTQSPNALTFIIDKQNTPIGRLILDFGRNIAHIIDIALIKKARNKGYGKAIIQAVQYTATKESMPVGLTVAKQDAVAMQLYAALGFTREETNHTHDFMVWYPPGEKTFVNV